MAEPKVTGLPSAESQIVNAPQRKPVAPTVERPPDFADWYPSADIVGGTTENKAFVERWKADPRMGREYERFDLSLKYEKNYLKELASFRAEVQSAAATGSPVLANPGRVPKKSAYAGWVSQFGETPDEVTTNISSTHDRVSHIVKRIQESGFYDKMIKDPNLARDFEDGKKSEGGSPAIVDYLYYNGGLKNEQERELFVRHFNSPYSKQWGLSIYQHLYEGWKSASPNRVWQSSNLPMEILQGRQLNPNSTTDVADFQRYKSWRSSEEGEGFFRNFMMGAGHLIGSMARSVKYATANLAYPEFDWSDDWKLASGENLELKQKFLEKFDAWIKDPDRSGDLRLESFARAPKQHGLTGHESEIYDVPDVDEIKPIDERTQELLGLYRELDGKGAFKMDIHGISALLSGLDAAVQGTLAISALGFSTDPDSWAWAAGTKFTQVKKDAEDVINGKGVDFENLLNYGLTTFAPIYSVFTDTNVSTRAEMSYFTNSVNVQRWFMDKAEQGLIVGGRWYDSNVGYNTSMWADAFLVAAPLAKGITAVRGARAQAAIKGSFEAMFDGVNAEHRGFLANVEYLVKKKMGFSVDTQKYIDAAMAELKARKGRDVTEVETVEAILNGEALFESPTRKGTKVALTRNEMQVFKQDIVNHANNVWQIRREVATAAQTGKQWYERLSQTSKDTMSKVRARLAEIEPNGGWDKANDSVVYARMRAAPLTKEGAKSAIDITEGEIKNLYKEVGEIWSGVNVTGKSGFRAADSLGMQWWDPNLYYYGGATGLSWTLEKLAKGLGFMSNKVVKWLGAHAINPSEVQTVLRTTTNSNHELSTTRLNVGGQTALERVSLVNRWIQAANVVGDFEAAFASMKDYFLGTMKTPLNATGTIHELKRRYLTRIDEISEILEINQTRGTKLKAAEEAALRNELGMLTKKVKFVSRVDAGTRYGFFDNFSQIKGYGGSLVVGEGLMLFNDTESFGLGSGFVSAMRGGHIISNTVYKNLSPTLTIKERANLDLYSLSMRINSMAPEQGAILIETLARLAKRRDETYREPGRGILRLSPEQRADVEFAMGVSILDRLFSLNGDIILSKGTGIIDGVAMLQSAVEYRTNPELRQQFIDKLQEQAGKLGLSNEEARAYALQIMEGHEKFLTSRQRIASIDEEIAGLEGQKKEIGDKIGNRLSKVKEALDFVIKQAGLSPELLKVINRPNARGTLPMREQPPRVRKDGTVYFEGGVPDQPTFLAAVTYGGKPLNEVPDISKQVLDRLHAVYQEKMAISMAIQGENNNIVSLNDQIRRLGEERSTLMQVPESAGFANRLVSMNPDGSYVINRKGLTIWEVPSIDPNTGIEVTRARVYLDVEHFLQRATFDKDGKMLTPHGYSVALEEFAHAIYFSELMRDGRIQMERDILGGWSVDENGEFVNKVLNSEGVLVDSPAAISGDAKTNLQIIRRYAEAYSEALPSDAARAEFLARYDYGVAQWEKNPLDTRHLQGVFMELWSSMYVQRNMSGNFQSVKSKFGSAESYTGNWNTAPINPSPIVTGSDGFRNWAKFVAGQTTLVDIFMKGRYDILNLDPNSPEAANAEQYLKSVMNVVNYFGPSGFLAKHWRRALHERMEGVGVVPRGNSSNDPYRFWNMDEMWGPDGSFRQMPFEAKGWVDGGIRDTRGLGSLIPLDDPFNIQRIISKQGVIDDPEEVKFRVMWAYATGRKHWLSSANDPIRVGTQGQNRQMNIFKKKVEELFWMENRVVRDFVGMVVKDDPDGATYGLQVRKSGNAYTLVGQPNPEQANKVFAWIKEQNRIMAEEDNLFTMNEQTMSVVKEMLSSLSNASFHKDASNPGYNRVYRGEYQGVTTGVGAGTTASVKATSPREMTFSPLMLIIKDTQLTAEGTKIFKGQNKEGEIAYMSRPMLYILGMDHNSRGASVSAAWFGRLSDRNGKIYPWTNDDMVNLFGSQKNFNERYMEVLQNYATGKYGIGDNAKPEMRSWEILMPYAGGDKKKALKMAAIIHRTIGTFESSFIEATKMEKDALLTRSESRRKALLEAAAEKKGEMEYPPTEREQWLSEIMGHDRLELGAQRMSDTRHPFFLIRPDRFIGMPTPVAMNKKQNAVFPMTGAAYGFAQIGYATQGLWGKVDMTRLQAIRSSYEWGSSRLSDAWEHPGGYIVWSVMNRKGGKFQPARYALIGPDGAVLEKQVGNKTFKDFDTKEAAFEWAGQHSKQNRRSNVPIVGNEVEQNMKEAGWLPRGLDFKINARSEFSSIDNKWFIRRNKRGGWDLYENGSELMVMNDIRIYGQKADKGGRPQIDPKELAASVQLAEESGIRQVAIDFDFVKKHKPSLLTSRVGELTANYMEWMPGQGRITQPLQRTRFAQDNAFYWEFKRTLAQSTSPAFAIEAARRLVEDLGEAAVEGDKDGTLTRKWATEFIQRLDEEGMFSVLIDKRSFAQIKADEHLEVKREMARKLREGAAADEPKSRPTKPKERPTKPVEAAYDTVEAYNEALVEFDRLNAEYDRQLGDWQYWQDALTLHEQAVMADEVRSFNIRALKDLINRDIKTVNQWRVPMVGGGTPEATANLEAINKFIRAENALREAGQAVASDYWTSKTGFLIQKMMYDEPKIGPGINIRFADDKPLNVKQGQRVNFWLFTQQGQLVGKFDTFEEAQNGVLGEMMGLERQYKIKSLRNNPNERKATK